MKKEEIKTFMGFLDGLKSHNEKRIGIIEESEENIKSYAELQKQKVKEAFEEVY